MILKSAYVQCLDWLKWVACIESEKLMHNEISMGTLRKLCRSDFSTIHHIENGYVVSASVLINGNATMRIQNISGRCHTQLRNYHALIACN